MRDQSLLSYQFRVMAALLTVTGANELPGLALESLPELDTADFELAVETMLHIKQPVLASKDICEK